MGEVVGVCASDRDADVGQRCATYVRERHRLGGATLADLYDSEGEIPGTQMCHRIDHQRPQVDGLRAASRIVVDFQSGCLSVVEGRRRCLRRKRGRSRGRTPER